MESKLNFDIDVRFVLIENEKWFLLTDIAKKIGFSGTSATGRLAVSPCFKRKNKHLF